MLGTIQSKSSEIGAEQFSFRTFDPLCAPAGSKTAATRTPIRALLLGWEHLREALTLETSSLLPPPSSHLSLPPVTA